MTTKKYKFSKKDKIALEFFTNKLGSDNGLSLDLDTLTQRIEALTGSSHKLIYQQLELIYEYYVCSVVANRKAFNKRISKLAEKRGFRLSKKSHPASVLFHVCCGLERKLANKRSRAIRFAFIKKTMPDDFINFIKENGGLELSSRKFSSKKGTSDYGDVWHPKFDYDKIYPDLYDLSSTDKIQEIRIIAKMRDEKITLLKVEKMTGRRKRKKV